MFFFHKKSGLYFIQINDEAINKEICSIIVQIEKCLREFQEILKNEIYEEKEEKSLSIYKLLIQLKQKIGSISADVDKILNIELEKKEFIQINDKNFLSDKHQQLKNMSDYIDSLIAIMEAHPNNFEYKAGIMQMVLTDINKLVDALKKILNDDKQLEKIYSALAVM